MLAHLLAQPKATKSDGGHCYASIPDDLPKRPLVAHARSRLTRSGRRNYVFFYGVSPSNALAFEAAARVRRSHA